MKNTAVIMAGGKGERFWPKSRSDLPKQFLSLTQDGKTMIQLTAERHLPVIPYEDMFVVTNIDYVQLVREQLPQIPVGNILAEPMARNTAPCIGLAAMVITKKYEDAVMLVLASDHLIKNNDMYLDTMMRAVRAAKNGKSLITIGITPSYPETGYGYINFGLEDREMGEPGVYRVKRFVEKPNVDTAKEYLSSGKYLWNSGMFVWKASTILERIQELLPDTYSGLEKIRSAYGTDEYERVLTTCFGKFASESIDYGIMERATPIYTLPGNFGWDDVGSWLAIERINKTDESGNWVQGDVITHGVKNSVIFGHKRLISVVGLEDVIIVDTEDALLLCAKEKAQDVKKVISSLKEFNRNELL